MKRVLLCAALAMSAVFASPRAVSGPKGDELAQCVIASTTQADRRVLVQWMVGSLSQHPSVKDAVKLSDAQRDRYDQGMADLYQRLLTQACPAQVREAVSDEGTAGIEVAFEQLGRLAVQEAFSDPAVAKGLQNTLGKIDMTALQNILTVKP